MDSPLNLRSRRTVAALLCLLSCLSYGCSQDEQKRKALASGDSYAASGKYNEAIIQYRRAIQIDSKDGQVRLRLARTYLKNGDSVEGLREMLRASDLLPGDVATQLALGNLLLGVNRFEDARVTADRVLRQDPRNALAHVLRGNALARLKDLDGALKDMENAISADPADGTAYAGLGAVQLARGDLQSAEESFKKALDVQPDSADLRLSYATFLLANRRQADAGRELAQAYAMAPESVMVNRALAGFHVITRRPADAEVHLKKLAGNPASASWAGFVLARFYLATGRPDDAVRVLQELTGSEDTALEAKLQLAGILYNRAQREEAHRLVADVLAVNAIEPRALVLKAGFLLDEDKPDEAIAVARVARQNARVAQASLLLGLGYSRIGNTEEARKAFTDALSIDPRSIGAQLELSRISLMTGDAVWAQRYGEQALRAAPQMPAAREAVVRAALARGDVQAAAPPLAALRRDRPDDPEFLYLEGELRVQEGRRGAARKSFTRAAEIEPRSLATVTALIRLDLSDKNVAAARARADQAVARSPRSQPALLLAGRTYATSGDFARAESYLRRAIDADPARPEAYGTLANLYVAQNKVDEALKQLHDAVARDPKSVGTHVLMAMVLTKMGRGADAKSAYRQALSIDRDNAVAANNLAFLYAEDNENLEIALQLAEAAKGLLPGDADAIDTLGWVYHKKRMPTYAVSELQDAVAKQPQNASFHYHLGLAYAQGGDAKQARPTLERALSLDPASPLAADAQRVLASLKN